MSEIIYEHYGSPPPGVSILSVEHTYLNLRVFFSKGMINDDELVNPENYTIVVSTPTADFDFGPLSVTVEPEVTYPTYIDIAMTDCSQSGSYELQIASNAIRSSEHTESEPDYVLGTSGQFAFVGVTEDPVVLSVVTLSLESVKVIFSKSMTQNEELFNSGNYSWTGGIRTLKVEKDTNLSVLLTVTPMIPSYFYELTVG